MWYHQCFGQPPSAGKIICKRWKQYLGYVITFGIKVAVEELVAVDASDTVDAAGEVGSCCCCDMKYLVFSCL